MAQQKYFFDEFDATSKEAWLEKVKADLRGKALESLNFEVEEGLEMTPFFHRSDAAKYPTDGLNNFRKADWKIGAGFEVKEPVVVNAVLKEALAGGVNAPMFLVNEGMTLSDIAKLYEGVEPAWIVNYFDGKNTESLFNFWTEWMSYLKEKDYNLKEISGNLGLPIPTELSEEHLGVLTFVKREMPNFSVFRIAEDKDVDSSTGLASLLRQAHQLFELYPGNSLEIARQIQFSVWVDKQFFSAIAKIRALHIIWANLLKAYDCPSDLVPDISVHFAPEVQSADEYQNMISASTIALSAAIGGATTIFISPASNPETELTRRMARNVNHLLMMESYVNKVADPAAGSYYIEALTKEFAERAWRKGTGSPV